MGNNTITKIILIISILLIVIFFFRINFKKDISTESKNSKIEIQKDSSSYEIKLNDTLSVVIHVEKKTSNPSKN